MTFTGYDQKKKGKVGIETTPLARKIRENIDILSKILIPLENEIIMILNTKGPLTTTEIRNNFIEYKASLFPDFINEKNIPNINLKGGKTSLKIRKELEKNLKSKKVYIPSYDKFEYALQSLEKIGIIGKRFDPLKKGRFLWLLSPDFVIETSKKNKEPGKKIETGKGRGVEILADVLGK